MYKRQVKSLYALSELSVKATPLILIALGLAVCFRSNVWNIGAEGQFITGALAAGWVAMQAGPDTAWLGRGIVVPLSLIHISSFMTTPASSHGSMSARDPLKVPMAERAALRTTTSRLLMPISCC